MDGVNQTLYIPLYGKALVSRKGILLQDQKAEEIWAAEGFSLKGKSKSKWLAYYMGMRSAVFDRWVKEKMQTQPCSIVLHLGCGLDNRIGRVNPQSGDWYDVDFPAVIQQRKRHYAEIANYHMVGSDVRETDWLDMVVGDSAIVVMEGISMYLRPEELENLLAGLCRRFETVFLLMDCYTTFAARMSKIKNPINDVGVTEVYGLDDPKTLESTGLCYVAEKEMTPEDMICQLDGLEQKLFRKLYAGKTSKKLYRMYEFSK